MSNYVNDALLDASPYKKQQDEAKNLVNKWDKTGLLDGLNEDFQKSGMATMLENQAKQLINENSVAGGGAGSASGGTAGSEEWSGVALPLVRRIFGELAAQDFVSVQPMNLPSGLVFYLDFKYGTNTGAFGNSNSPSEGASVESMGGKTGPNNPSGSSAPYGVGGLYGNGKYDYSIKSTESDALSLGASATTSNYTTGSVNFKDLNFNKDYSASLAAVELFKINVAATAIDAKFDDKAARAVKVISSSALVIEALPEFTTTDGETVTLIVSGAAATVFANNDVKVTIPTQPTEADRGDFESTSGAGMAIPEVDLQLKSSAIVAKTRKLKAVWSPELAQDLNAYHSVDAEAELTSMLSEYISMEIDLEILDMLMNDAVTTDYWSATPGEDYDGSGAAESDWNITTFYGTRFEWYQTLLGKIQKVSNEIQRLTLRGGANFCVVSPTVATILESIPGYMTNTDGNKSQFAAGIQVAGQLQNRFTVYKNPYMTENTILVGFRGSNFLETGAVYSPYVPLIMTPLVYDPSDFTPRKGVMTRYAKKMIRPEFYGKIHCKDLNLV